MPTVPWYLCPCASVLWAIAPPVCLMLPVLWPLSINQAQGLRCGLSPLGLSLELSVPLTLAEDTMALPAHRVLLEASSVATPHTRPPSSPLHLAKFPCRAHGNSWTSSKPHGGALSGSYVSSILL